MLDSVNGVIEKVIHANGKGFIIFSVRNASGATVVTGNDAGLYEGDYVECEGTWELRNGNRQLKARKIMPQIPTTTDAILAYIASGRVPGISTKLAGRLVQAFGKDTLHVIEHEPDKLKKVPGFGKAKIAALTEGLAKELGHRGVMLFLNGFGLSQRHINKIFDTFGLAAVEKIKENPYTLFWEIKGIGFKIADKIAEQCGQAADDPYRILVGLLTAIDNAVHSRGDTCFEPQALAQQAHKLFARTTRPLDRATILMAMDLVKSSDFVRVDTIDSVEMIWPKELYYAEKKIAKDLFRLHNGTGKIASADALKKAIAVAEKALGITLSPMQHQAVTTALASPVSVITGGPGTGKTTIMRVLLLAQHELFHVASEQVVLCAPTGKASKRLQASTQMEAMTLHKVLKYSPEDNAFTYHEDNKLPCEVAVTDESSMIDTQLACSFFQAIPSGAKLVIVGDYDQLASVGAGKVLRDIIESDTIPVVRLDRVFRTGEDSQIKVNAHLINKAQMITLDNKSKQNDFWFIKSPTPEAIADEIVSLIPRLVKHYGYDPLDDIQVLTPMRMGPVGMHALNARLQRLMNPNAGTGIRCTQDDVEVQFCAGDKVIHIKNNNELKVVNGDTGKIISVDLKERKLIARFEDVQVEYAYADLDELRLCYAMTIHKSQGSEYPCVLMPMTLAHDIMLSINLVYTGMTRARQNMLMVGQLAAVERALTRRATDLRSTGLLHFLKQLWANQQAYSQPKQTITA
ncbi:ATP-dependent RecD-like DNA helicase [Pseudomonas sp. S1(2024)]|uniref:SF1B family DNA helicase RecD2 n=1 Tax=Pseudomonas sp. S1(2024) TaxID=3390191 RepID=UPI0039781739